MLWDSTSPSRRTRRNRRIRGGGTWGNQARRLDQHEHRTYERQMGRGLWSDKNRKLDRARRQRERQSRRVAKRHGFVTPLAASALILGLVLLVTGASGPALLVLILAGIALYLVTGRKKV